jgi:hypothetical protein
MATAPVLLDAHGGVQHQDRSHLLVATAADLAALGEQNARARLQAVQLPKLSVTADGWLVGDKVRHEPIGSPEYSNAWRAGHPIGVLDHFTDGCGDPFGTLKSRGVSVHGCVMQDASIVQFAPFTVGTAHAYDQAFYTIGIEHAAAPGIACEFMVPMLERSAQLNAAILDWIGTHYGVAIPTVRSPGWHYTPGIKAHADGLEPGSPWDPKDHWDAVWQAEGDPIKAWLWASAVAALNRSPWTSADYIAAVARYRGEGDPVSQEVDDLIAGFTHRAKHLGNPGKTAREYVLKGYLAADALADAILKDAGTATGPAAVTATELANHAKDGEAHHHNHKTGLAQQV